MGSVKILLATGQTISLQEWQKQYGLAVGSTKVGKYLSTDGDPIIARDMAEYGECLICEHLIKILDTLRSQTGQPIVINSLNRSADKQVKLIASGIKAAKQSPHVVKLAVDIDTQSAMQTKVWVKKIQDIAKQLKIKVRLGYNTYLKEGKTFIHIDVGPMYYAKGKPWNLQYHPEVWEQEVSW